MKFPKIAVLASVICLAAYLGYKYVTADPPGYCRMQKRYISDEEFIRTTVALLEWDMNSEVLRVPEGKKGKRKELSTLYKKWDFDPKDPNCCSVGRGQAMQSTLRRMFGFQEVFVRINPKKSTEPATLLGDGFIEFKYSICGRLLDSSIGLSSNADTEITTTNYLAITSRK